MSVALVTGVSRRIGIGAAVARRLAEAGMDLFLHSWSPARRRAAVGRGRRGPGVDRRRPPGTRVRVEHLATDLADADAPARLVDAAENAFGRVDVLVANHARSSASPGGADGSRAGPDLRRQHARDAAAGEGVRPACQRARSRCAHDVGAAPRADARRAALHRLQGRAPPAHREPRRAPRAPRDHRQLRGPGRNRHGLRRRGGARGRARAGADGPLGRAGRRRPPHRLAGE